MCSMSVRSALAVRASCLNGYDLDRLAWVVYHVRRTLLCNLFSVLWGWMVFAGAWSSPVCMPHKAQQDLPFGPSVGFVVPLP